MRTTVEGNNGASGGTGKPRTGPPAEGTQPGLRGGQRGGGEDLEARALLPYSPLRERFPSAPQRAAAAPGRGMRVVSGGAGAEGEHPPRCPSTLLPRSASSPVPPFSPAAGRPRSARLGKVRGSRADRCTQCRRLPCARNPVLRGLFASCAGQRGRSQAGKSLAQDTSRPLRGLPSPRARSSGPEVPGNPKWFRARQRGCGLDPKITPDFTERSAEVTRRWKTSRKLIASGFLPAGRNLQIAADNPAPAVPSQLTGIGARHGRAAAGRSSPGRALRCPPGSRSAERGAGPPLRGPPIGSRLMASSGAP